MNKWNYILYIILIGYLFGNDALAQTGRALIVTISNYPSDSGWESIHANNDKDYILEILSDKNFQSGHIITLSDKQATKKGVTSTFEKLCNATKPGDAIFLHFSCHGQQMMDDNGDEEDGLDEGLVLYDAKYKYTSGKYEGQNHLRDDELGVWIHKLRRKAGEKGRVTVTLDACHSGTANRDGDEYIYDHEEYMRGTTTILAPEGYIPSPGKNQHLSLRLKKQKQLATTAVFSACLPQLTNYEYYDRQRSKYVGRLTYFFCKQIKEMKTPSTIKGFFEKLNKTMLQLTDSDNHLQLPYMECSDNAALFYIRPKE